MVLRSIGARLALLLTVALMLVFSWTAVAYAQTSADEAYGSPTQSGEVAIAEIEGPGAAVAAAESPPSGVLPETGGPLLPLVALGVFALSATGLIAIRRR